MAFVYINGYPGVGKLTVAKELTHVRPSDLAAILVQLILLIGNLYHHAESSITIALSIR